MRSYHFLLLISLLYCPTTFAVPATHQQPVILQVKEVPIVVNGKTTSIYRFIQPDGTIGISGVQGDELNVVVENKTNVPTSVHWHGIILPNNQDGVPYVTQKPIMPGENYHYRFKIVQAGTYWMHSHFRLQEQKLLAAPLILRDPTEKLGDQEVVMFLEDFSFKDPKLIYKNLRCQQYVNERSTDKASDSDMNMNMDKDMHMNMNAKKMQSSSSTMSMSHQAMDLNDVRYDAFLANEHNLENPRVYRIKPNTTIRLRIINGSASTNFHIKPGNLNGQAIAVDGERIKALTTSSFQLGIGQRADLMLKIPGGEGSYPILAQGEGSSMQTGIILATSRAPVPKLPTHLTMATPAFDYAQEQTLSALSPLAEKKPNVSIRLNLGGDMQKYVWKINNQVWPNISPIKIRAGDRVEFIFNNMTAMSHPMHFHGHVFQVTQINDAVINGAKRDTILVLPHSSVKIQFDATNSGVWMLHCHNLYHSAGGMITKLLYDDYQAPKFTIQEQASMAGSLMFSNAQQCLRVQK